MFIAICPPAFFAAINPRVDAIEAMKNGAKREELDAFDNLTPLTDRNKRGLNIAFGWLAVFYSFMWYVDYKVYF